MRLYVNILVIWEFFNHAINKSTTQVPLEYLKPRDRFILQLKLVYLWSEYVNGRITLHTV